MKRYRVFFTDRVIQEIDLQIDYLRSMDVSERVIASWFGKLFAKIEDLYALPQRYPVDQPESRIRNREVRKMIFHAYVIRYRVDEALQVVYVLSLTHAARQTRE